MITRGPLVYLNHRGGLAGLGQPSGFDEAALQLKLGELQRIRAEIEAVEAETESVRTGRPVRRAAPGAPLAPPVPALASGLPGGSVKIPVVGQVPLVVVGAAAVLMFMRRK